MQVDITKIKKGQKQVSQNERRFIEMNDINQSRQTPNKTQVPKDRRDHDSLLLLRHPPLDYKSRAKGECSQKAD